MSKPIENRLSTRKNMENARKSFESITGKKVKGATLADIEQWLNSLREMGRATSTCRTYLSFVNQLAGMKAEMPKRTKTQNRTLRDAEIKSMLAVVVGPDFHALLASLMLCGTDVQYWTWGMIADLTLDTPIAARILLMNEAQRRGYVANAFLAVWTKAHWINGVNLNETIFPQTSHDINRRLKSIARKAGIGEKNVHLTTLKNTHKRLLIEYKDAERIAKALGIVVKASIPVSLPAKRTETRLNGIGRRTPLMKTA